MKIVKKLLIGTFWTALAVASIFVVLTTVNLFGFQMFVVKSGSMEPKIKTGSVVLDERHSNYEIGDVITFKESGTETITHRIYSINTEDGVQKYITKGDANNSPDINLVAKENVVGKEMLAIPYLGYVVAFLRTLPGLIIFIIVPATIIVYEELGNIKREIIKIRHKSNETTEATE